MLALRRFLSFSRHRKNEVNDEIVPKPKPISSRSLIDMTVEEVLAKGDGKGSNSLLVIYSGLIYDVSEFAVDHPGGADLILDYAGRDISEAFETVHPHSDTALAILADFCVGKLLAGESPDMIIKEELGMNDYLVTNDSCFNLADYAGGKKRGVTIVDGEGTISEEMNKKKDDSFIDLDKPLFVQLLKNTWSKAYYLEQVHIPRYRSRSPNFFASPILDALTKNVWWGVLLFWIPVVSYLAIFAVNSMGLFKFMCLYMVGLVLWSFYEYMFHRFLFHMDHRLPDHPLAFAVHFTIHGVHHFLPTDRYRLVMPPLLMVSLALPTASVYYHFIGLGSASTASLMAGSLTGYIAYDMLHYAFHHATIKSGFLNVIKSHHMRHHFVSANSGFGVSSFVWDIVFGTEDSKLE